MSCPSMCGSAIYNLLPLYLYVGSRECLYTRHKPILSDTMDTLVEGKLKETHFPYAGDHQLVDK